MATKASRNCSFVILSVASGSDSSNRTSPSSRSIPNFPIAMRKFTAISASRHSSRLCVVTTNKRLECLEALMAVNFRIAMGKFGMDLDDGEVRLEELIPLATDSITKEQLRLAFVAMMQTVAVYSKLIPRIVDGNMTTQQVLQACEQEFFSQAEVVQKVEAPQEMKLLPARTTDGPETATELDVNDVLAEVARILEGKTE